MTDSTKLVEILSPELIEIIDSFKYDRSTYIVLGLPRKGSSVFQIVKNDIRLIQLLLSEIKAFGENLTEISPENEEAVRERLKEIDTFLHIDFFEYQDLLLPEIKSILKKYEHAEDYLQLESMQKELSHLGWSMEFYLSCEVFNLTPILS